jgi:EAL domain-containing protein (putative c-di-GMP-specific phosphodiesterase class I)
MTQRDAVLRGGGRGRVLLVEDEAPILSAMSRWLTNCGFDVACASNGLTAAQLLEQGEFDVIVSDIAMPGLDGMALLKTVRHRDLEVPVILATGAPELRTAIDAVALGAFEYLVKPIDLATLEKTVSRAHLLHRLARVKRQALDFVSQGGLGLSDRVALEASFDRALASMWMAYQPIVHARDRTLFGYEALMRSTESTLPHPGAILDAAERLERVADIGRHVRGLAPRPLPHARGEAVLFINLHASDLRDPELCADPALVPIASRVVFEITERAALDRSGDVRSQIAELRAMGFRFAIDDLGAGYAGLTSFALLEPEFVKLDMSLVRGIDTNHTKQKLAEAVIAVCRDLHMQVVGEGIETAAERDVLVSLGCDLLQGYLLARPGKPFPPYDWGPAA